MSDKVTAQTITEAALGHMKDRAATYDAPKGERSMAKTVAAFNALTGLALTVEQGWLFMLTLKMARSQQGGYRADNHEDAVAYAALMGEEAAVRGDEKAEDITRRGIDQATAREDASGIANTCDADRALRAKLNDPEYQRKMRSYFGWN